MSLFTRTLFVAFLWASMVVAPFTHAAVNARNGITVSTASTINGISSLAEVNGLSLVSGGASYYDEVIADSPVGYWRLGETSGTSANDEGSGNTDGTYTGGYTLNQTSLLTTSPGSTNPSVALNGSSGYVAIGNYSAIQFSGSFSVECLVKFAGFPGDGAEASIVSKHFDSGSSKISYCLDLLVSGGGSTKTLRFFSYDGSTQHGTTYDVSAWTTGTTYHIVGTFDGSDWKLYVNGSNVATTSDSTGPQSNGRPLAIGAADTSFGMLNFFNGTVDEVAVYNTALSSTRITAHNAAR